MFASCGQERDIILWQGNTMRRVGELTGGWVRLCACGRITATVPVDPAPRRRRRTAGRCSYLTYACMMATLERQKLKQCMHSRVRGMCLPAQATPRR